MPRKPVKPGETPHQPDEAKSERVWAITEHLAPKVAHEIIWMTPELIEKLLQTFEGTRSLMLMYMMRAGMISHEQGQKLTPDQIFLMAFHVGLEVGQEYKAQTDFNKMWGGTPPDV